MDQNDHLFSFGGKRKIISMKIDSPIAKKKRPDLEKLFEIQLIFNKNESENYDYYEYKPTKSKFNLDTKGKIQITKNQMEINLLLDRIKNQTTEIQIIDNDVSFENIPNKAELVIYHTDRFFYYPKLSKSYYKKKLNKFNLICSTFFNYNKEECKKEINKNFLIENVFSFILTGLEKESFEYLLKQKQEKENNFILKINELEKEIITCGEIFLVAEKIKEVLYILFKFFIKEFS